MAKVRSNPIVQGLSGRLGRNLMFRQLSDGRTIMCVKPDFSRRTLSAGQKNHHERFREASAYARAAAGSQPLYAKLAAGTLKTAYNIALSDWFHAPVIHAIQVQVDEGRVRISASDNVHVAQVSLTVLDAQGNTLERGEAMRAEGLWWEYTLTVQPEAGQQVIAEAQDLAGNVTRAQQ